MELHTEIQGGNRRRLGGEDGELAAAPGTEEGRMLGQIGRQVTLKTKEQVLDEQGGGTGLDWIYLEKRSSDV